LLVLWLKKYQRRNILLSKFAKRLQGLKILKSNQDLLYEDGMLRYIRKNDRLPVLFQLLKLAQCPYFFKISTKSLPYHPVKTNNRLKSLIFLCCKFFLY